jgi:hypothetical protein
LGQANEAEGDVKILTGEEMPLSGIGKAPNVLEQGDVEAGKFEKVHGVHALELAGAFRVGNGEELIVVGFLGRG